MRPSPSRSGEVTSTRLRLVVLGLIVVIQALAAVLHLATTRPRPPLELYSAPQLVDDYVAEHPALRAISAQPQFTWLGEQDDRSRVEALAAAAAASGGAGHPKTLPVVLYAIPNRDLGSHSAGGFRDGADYLAWVGSIAPVLGRTPTMLVLEPDALGQGLAQPPAERAERERIMAAAVRILTGYPSIRVYVDASMWVPADAMAGPLLAVGVGRQVGFSINVSNYQSTQAAYAYGDALSRLVHGAHYLIDTSRNGNGPQGSQWCNPPGRALGAPPQLASTHHPHADALVWVKRPGMSDGPCHGGPPAGQFSSTLANALVAARPS